ncbi:MAG: DUF2272 domain-containing protein, partial [Janthinobacterium lividum]
MAQSCSGIGSHAALGNQLASLALQEYTRFNGHRIDAEGHLWKFGSVESETELLHDPRSGLASAAQPGRYAWRRVWEYWLTLDQHRPGSALDRKVVLVPQLIENPQTSDAADEIRLRDLLLPVDGDNSLQSARREGLNQAAIRAAMNDSPWSATFISFLMHQAGLSAEQFDYAAAHWRYIQHAFDADETYAYRACDARHAVPAVGDLLCHARGQQALESFDAWRQAVGQPGFSMAAHCELVIDVDLAAKKIELVGGNVLQSIARRKLKLNEDNL